MSDAPSGTQLRHISIAVAAIVACLVFDAAIDDRSEGDPAASLGHQLLAIGPVIAAVVALGLVAVVALRTRDRLSRRTQAAWLLTALSALYAAGALTWEIVLDTTTAHDQDAGGLILCSLVGLVTGVVWLTVLWRRRRRSETSGVAERPIVRFLDTYGPPAYPVVFTVLAVLALSTLVIGPEAPNAIAAIISLLAIVAWIAARVVRLLDGPVLPDDVRPERPGDIATDRYLAPAREGRIARSWRLTRVAIDIIRADRTAVVVSMLAVVLNLAATALLFGLAGWFHGGDDGGRTARLAWLAAVFAWPTSFLSTYLNVALAAAASARLDGRKLSLRAAFGVASGRLRQIAGWSLLAAGVGVLLHQIAERVPLGARLVTWIAGTGWSLVTLFAVPILALEGCGATACARRSARLQRERWGESIGGTITLTAWTMVVILPASLLVAVIAAVSDAGGDATIAAVIVFAIAIGAIANAARQVFAVALYRYAVDGDARGFHDTDLQQPFEPKPRWRRR